MYFVAAVLAVLSGLFYAAGNHEIGSYSSDVCRYGSMFSTIRTMCWSAPVSPRSGAPSSASSDGLNTFFGRASLARPTHKRAS